MSHLLFQIFRKILLHVSMILLEHATAYSGQVSSLLYPLEVTIPCTNTACTRKCTHMHRRRKCFRAPHQGVWKV